MVYMSFLKGEKKKESRTKSSNVKKERKKSKLKTLIKKQKHKV